MERLLDHDCWAHLLLGFFSEIPSPWAEMERPLEKELRNHQPSSLARMPPALEILKCLVTSDNNSVARLRAGQQDLLVVVGGYGGYKSSKWSLVFCVLLLRDR